MLNNKSDQNQTADIILKQKRLSPSAHFLPQVNLSRVFLDYMKWLL